MVCVRPAHGYHCDVATCKGCKTFFRRMCLLRGEIKCSTSGDCYDLEKRNSPLLRCRPCRFKRCLLVGMNPKALIIDGSNILGEKQVHFNEQQIQGTIDVLSHLEAKTEQFSKCAYNPDWTNIRLKDLILSPSKLSMSDKVGTFPDWPLCPNYEFPDQIVHRDIQSFSPHRKQWRFSNLMTAVEYTKTFSFFHDLSFQDQINLLKHVVIGLANFNTTYYTLKNKFDDLRQPDGTQRPGVNEPHYCAHTVPFGPMKRIKIQFNEFLLLKILFVCNPAVPNLSKHAQFVIEKERHHYSNILLKYCLQNYSYGPTRFVELIEIFGVLHRQQKLMNDLYIYVLSPLLLKLPKEFSVPLIEEIVLLYALS
ncbi:Nuclear Hormone Receptor family [Caenorhabditis elegans]|nr:Nuclear Hormone Receptor family [Caenorhabditis elegans]CZR14589.1 Nuclear Hormone Receptor family [Caenorhabditis elegans]|eukprot:NP_001309664.1 Nuclear Hormone Receptor family [Caenorhabditis elegans]